MGRADALRQLDELRLEIADVRASRRRLAMADDAERRSIERVFHDEVQQQLVGLATGLELAAASMDTDPVAAERLLTGIGEEVLRTLEAARRLAHRISPPLLEAGGLTSALRSAAASAEVPARIDIQAGAACPPEVAGTVYRCCLRLLERAGGGTPVTVTVRSDERTLRFEVVADCDLQAERLELGDRVEALGGELSLSSESDGRTRVIGSVPLSG
jgi:signal transduction histidine kinase